MTTKHLGIAAAVFVADTLLLLAAGAAMWSEAPSQADEAVGKGLFVLGVALAIPSFVVTLAFLSSRAMATPLPQPTRSDWDPV